VIGLDSLSWKYHCAAMASNGGNSRLFPHGGRLPFTHQPASPIDQEQFASLTAYRLDLADRADAAPIGRSAPA